MNFKYIVQFFIVSEVEVPMRARDLPLLVIMGSETMLKVLILADTIYLVGELTQS